MKGICDGSYFFLFLSKVGQTLYARFLFVIKYIYLCVYSTILYVYKYFAIHTIDLLCDIQLVRSTKKR